VRERDKEKERERERERGRAAPRAEEAGRQTHHRYLRAKVAGGRAQGHQDTLLSARRDLHKVPINLPTHVPTPLLSFYHTLSHSRCCSAALSHAPPRLSSTTHIYRSLFPFIPLRASRAHSLSYSLSLAIHLRSFLDSSFCIPAIGRQPLCLGNEVTRRDLVLIL
jgi:hypothetical protein